MFRWFSKTPVYPVSDEERNWMDDRFEWLISEFGRDRLNSAEVLLPNSDHFPDRYRACGADVRSLMRRIGEHLDLDTDRLKLRLYSQFDPSDNHLPKHAAGFYSEGERWFEIGIESSIIDDPYTVVATLAHELCHVKLLGEGRLSENDADHEWVTDLATVFFGLGVFTANNGVREGNWNSGTWSGWSMSRLGYFSLNHFAYAHAIFAAARNDRAPWRKHLRLDVRSGFEQSLKLLVAR